ncbi:MAG TPA: uracil-DNA glycosylase [Candidatus Saccharimonadales bacterium]|jgi:DNA polymerase
MADTTKQQKLDEIKAKIVADKVCPELAKTATNMVFGDGNPDAEIVFIGEAPGKNEDLQGLPFVGAAGKFLDEMLDSVGLKRKDVYISNIVKYRPPNNRDPLPEEKQAFLPCLQAQLEIIQPKLVVTLGRHSTNCFLPDLQISKIHGQPKRIRIRFGGKTPAKLVIMPLYHPASALYNGSMRQTLLDDFAKIPEILKLIDK